MSTFQVLLFSVLRQRIGEGSLTLDLETPATGADLLDRLEAQYPAIGEYRRVLKPGGTLWILEGHLPSSRIGHRLTRFVWNRVIPGMTLVFTRSRDAKVLMDYYWDTVEKSVPPDTILRALREVGMERPRYRVIVPGAFCEYTAKKPPKSPVS